MYQLSIATHIGIVGETEDRRPYTAEIFSVVAQAPDGSRYLHVSDFNTAWTEFTDEGQHIVHIEMFTAAEKCEALRNELLERPTLDVNTIEWIQVSPEFGSKAYNALNLAAIEDI